VRWRRARSIGGSSGDGAVLRHLTMQINLKTELTHYAGASWRRIALAPRLTLEVDSDGRIHFTDVEIKLKDPATDSELPASEWAARFGPRVLPAPGAVTLAPRFSSVKAYDEHGLSIKVTSSGRSHSMRAELRRWEEGSTEWSAAPAPWEQASFHKLY